MAPTKKKSSTNENGVPDISLKVTLADAVLPVKVNSVPAEEEVFASPQVSSDYSWMRSQD